jgi:hypothetical protein
MFPGYMPKGHIYPDGTKASRKPRDGEKFYITKNGVVESTWQWDDVMDKWVNISSGKPTKANTASYPPSIKYTFAGTGLDIAIKDPKTAKCECGSEAVGSPRHSSWCCKYDPLS